jgi:ureidoglycolate hydrolase
MGLPDHAPVTRPSQAAVPLTAEPITPDAFRPFGHVILPGPDGAPWQPEDAVLQLGSAPPRLYLMRLPARGLLLRDLASHRRVSQALGVMDPHPWVLVVAPARLRSDRPADPRRDLRAFRIPPRCLVVLHPGTWHAGPLFESPADLVFCNLESRRTNEEDVALLPLAGGVACRVRWPGSGGAPTVGATGCGP